MGDRVCNKQHRTKLGCTPGESVCLPTSAHCAGTGMWRRLEQQGKKSLYIFRVGDVPANSAQKSSRNRNLISSPHPILINVITELQYTKRFSKNYCTKSKEVFPSYIQWLKVGYKFALTRVMVITVPAGSA